MKLTTLSASPLAAGKKATADNKRIAQQVTRILNQVDHELLLLKCGLMGPRPVVSGRERSLDANRKEGAKTP
jgi:hypothetical protein